jgi:tetratricopeptide (TPR) repeat protein/transcriptional regulator with XRE-family HTH domain
MGAHEGGPPSHLPFGTVLRRHRLAASLTQQELAERAGISVRRLGAMERGVPHAPRKDTLALLAQALALSPQEQAALGEAARRLRGAAPPAPTQRYGTGAPPFVGRARELALLERHLASQGPPALFLAGEPGIGKSRLLAEAVQRGAAAGWSVLLGGCTRSGGQVPYTPLLQALQRQMRGHAAAQQRSAVRGCAWLMRLLPELADGPIEPLPPWTVSAEQERRLLFEAVARFLANVAGPAGTLLVLDDLQWAGTDALDLMTSLVHGTPTTPLRLVGAHRDTEVHPPDPLAVALADLAGAGLARHLRLRPLAAAEIHQLLDLLLGEHGGDRAALAARVAERTAGVPFFVVSFAQALREDVAAGEEAIPWEVAQGIRQRVAALPALAQAVLGAAAIAVGRTAQEPVLATVLEQPEHAVLGALEAAWRARLLEELDGGYRIAHDLIRALLHRRTAEALEGRPGAATAEALAYHCVRGEVPERAVGYLEQAGDQAQRQHGRAAAEGFYQEAVERLDRLSRPLDAARVREKLGALLVTGARYAEALAALEPAAEAYRAAGDLEAAARVEAAVALVHVDAGTAAEGLARLEPALALLAGNGPTRALAALQTAQAGLLFKLGRYRDELAAAEQGERIARLVGDDLELAKALYLRGSALVSLGRLREAMGPLSAAIPVAEAAGVHWNLCWALHWLVEAQMELGLFVAARQAVERALQLAQRQGFRVADALLTMQRGWVAFHTGAWVAARRDLERAVAIGHEIGPFSNSVCVLLSLGELCLAEGAEAEAARNLEACERLLHAGEEVHTGIDVGCWLASVLAERDLLAGEPAAARARLAPWLDPDMPEEDDVAPALPLMAWALLALGALGEAAEVACQAVARARDQGRQVLLVDALRVAAMVAIRRGRWEEAEGALAEGLSLTQQLGYPYGEARLLQVYGDWHAQRGQLEPARERLAAALAIFQRLGARTAAEHAEQAVAALESRAEVVPDAPFLPAWRAVGHAPTGARLARADRQTWALERLRTAGPLSPRAYAVALGVSVDTALRDLQQLVDQGLVQAAGRTKKRRYTLIGDTAGPAIRRTGL